MSEKSTEERKYSDATSDLEQRIEKRELEASFRDYPRLLRFVLSSAFLISSLFLLLSVVRPLFTPFIAIFWKRFVDGVYALAPGMRIGIELVLLLVGYAALTFIQNIIQSMTTLNGEQAFLLDIVQANRFSEFVLTKMYAKVSRLPTEYYESPDFYDRTERAFSYAGEQMRKEVVVNVYAVIAGVVGTIAVFIALYSYHPLLSLVAVVAPAPSLYSQLIGSKITHAFKRDTSEDRRKLDYYEQLILRFAVKEFKVFNAGEFIMDKWEKVASKYLRREIRTRYRTEAVGLVGVVVNNAAAIGSALLAVWLLTQGEISLGAVGAVFALSNELTHIAGSVIDGIGKLISNRRDVSQLFEFLDLPEEETAGEPIPEEFRQIRAKDIRYRYPMTDRYVLDGIDCTIRSGEVVAFVGENGAGKSTFVKILLGLIRPSEGTLQYNDTPLSDLRIEEYRDGIGAVFQDFVQYRGLTVGDNVRLGDFESKTAVEPALSDAGFSAHTPETMLGRDLDGKELSGGEWQKLAIARGLYRNRDILVLDEPTASLDPLSEEEVFRRFLSMTEGKTSIIVTHRIGSAALANRILIFDAGRIVEEGTHDQLIANNGKYARMFAAQAEWYDR